MGNVEFTWDECAAFPGRWSLWPEQMWTALNALPEGMINVLEFGAGKGTDALAALLEAKGRLGWYASYETNSRYFSQNPRVQSVLYSKDEWPKLLTHGTPQLVIIDGPNGVDRAKWYPLLSPVVKPGTIIVADDFDHYPEFSRAMDSCLNYQLVSHVNLGRPSRSGCIVCWKTVRII